MGIYIYIYIYIIYIHIYIYNIYIYIILYIWSPTNTFQVMFNICCHWPSPTPLKNGERWCTVKPSGKHPWWWLGDCFFGIASTTLLPCLNVYSLRTGKSQSLTPCVNCLMGKLPSKSTIPGHTHRIYFPGKSNIFDGPSLQEQTVTTYQRVYPIKWITIPLYPIKSPLKTHEPPRIYPIKSPLKSV